MRSSSPLRSPRAAASVAIVLALVGCGLSGCGGGAEPVGHQADEVVVCHSPTVEGIDVSKYQGTIDWAKVKADGKVFGIARISDGVNTIDATFAPNWSGMKSVGMIRGAYQFFEPGQDATAQADLVVSKVGKLGDGDLPVTIDVEATGGQTAATIASKIATWLQVVEAGTGKKPIIYTGKYFWQDNVADTTQFLGYDLWLAAYVSGCPNTPNAYTDWKMWQYSSSGAVAGISGNVDLDVFAGTLADLQAYAGGGPDYAAKYVSQSWPLASTALQMKTGETVAATITLKNVGAKAWDANTKLATSNPRDRASEFRAVDWPASNRLDAVKGTVAPGSDYAFTFTFQAPATPGSYHEFFNLVEENVAWFSDPNQGGPKDDVIEAWIEVTQGPIDPDAGTDAGSDAGADTGAADALAHDGGDTGVPNVNPITSGNDSGGCSTAPGRTAAMAPFALLAGLALAARRRRR